MLNGRSHPSARNGVAVASRRGDVVAEADSNAFYGAYEQQLADELSQLLKSSPTVRPTGDAGMAIPAAPASALRQLPHTPADLPPVQPQPLLAPLSPPELPRQRGIVAAKCPDNDFTRAAERDDDPLPFTWRHEMRPPQPSWLSRQMRAAAIGLGAGLVIVLPAAAVLSGKLDPWLRAAPQSQPLHAAAAIPERRVAVAEKAPPVATVARVATTVVERPPEVAPGAPESLPASKAPVALAAPPVAPEPRIVPREVPSAVALAPAPIAGVRDRVEPFPTAPAAKAASAPAPAPAPTAPAPAEEAAGLLLLGRTLVKEGDIAGAREPLARAAGLGNPDAVLALGETFDPNMLAAWGVSNVKADANMARLFYNRAVSAGVPRAKVRLDALN